jgi:hypothetical protein
MRVSIEVSPGELYDKISILEIKLDRVGDPEKLQHVKNEYDTLKKCMDDLQSSMQLPYDERSNAWASPAEGFFETLEGYIKGLNEVNRQIWDILQKQRDLENRKDFGDKFVKASLSVYHLNDLRASHKLAINQLFRSDIAEVKSYPKDQ